MANLEISRAQRLDQRVVQIIPELSRAFGTKLIEQGKVSVNGVPQTKAGYKLRDGDEVVVDYDINQRAQVPEITLPILYEDDDCVVVNKPVGLLTHSKGEFNPEATVETWLRQHCKNIPPKQPGLSAMQGAVEQQTEPYQQYGEGVAQTATPQRAKSASEVNSSADEQASATWLLGPRAGIVHRLDRATSGVMICAKTPEALKWLQRQFAQRRTKKTYYAVVSGELKQPEAIIDMPVERNPKAPATFRVGHNGKSAVTHYKVLESNAKYSLLELKPETGRTHQLRVHLHHLGHSIVGDPLYDGAPAERMMLHAERLELTLPSRQRTTFEAPLPDSFREMVRG